MFLTKSSKYLTSCSPEGDSALVPDVLRIKIALALPDNFSLVIQLEEANLNVHYIVKGSNVNEPADSNERKFTLINFSHEDEDFVTSSAISTRLVHTNDP